MTATPIFQTAQAASLDRRRLMIGAGLWCTAGLAILATPRRHEAILGATRLAALVPDQIGPWSSQPTSDLILPEAEQPTSVYDQVLTRTYSSPGRSSVMLLIAYGAAQSGLMKVHRPEVCYASSGFRVGRIHNADVGFRGRSIAAETFTAQRQDRVEQVLYWTRVSSGFPRDLTAQRWLLLQRGLQGVIPDGVLVRASTLSDGPPAVATLQGFVHLLVSSASGDERGLLVGRT